MGKWILVKLSSLLGKIHYSIIKIGGEDGAGKCEIVCDF
ncbi:hypothetical protein CACET_c37450 [Clostridium aceticum]|uniref:Uncharacterized protein n=1 Tax=Clostridium aceticum TaxID=84022 RepID=A0A0G3WFP7_9CLOT|nr:hypothetical protein CACET_c37450 [Clostridium aceticum]